MNREQLEHVLRAAAAIAQENSLVVVHPERTDLIDGAIGAMSSFDETFGYYADGVGPDTAVMPPDWMDRARLYYIGEVTAICPDIHDLAVSKCVAARDKDADFVRVLLKENMIDAEVLEKRIELLDPLMHPVDAIRNWARRRVAEGRA